MACTRCGLFDKGEHRLCLCCRTVNRLHELVQGNLLVKDQEQQALTTLRVAAGALLDLAERKAANPPQAWILRLYLHVLQRTHLL